MTTHDFFVKNINCGPSRNTITTTLLKIKGVTAVDFFEEEYKVSVSCESVEREEMIANLIAMGYYQKVHDGLYSRKNTFDYWYCYCCSGCDS